MVDRPPLYTGLRPVPQHCMYLETGPFKISKLKWVTSVLPNTVRLATKTQGDNALRYGEKQPSMNLRDRPQETNSRDLERWLSSSENNGSFWKKASLLALFPHNERSR